MVCLRLQGTSQSRPTCVATVASMKRVDFVALQRKQGNGNEEGHHARVGYVVQFTFAESAFVQCLILP